MPKPINTQNPVASIRASLGLPNEDFAKFIGCGVSTLKQIESGRREIGIKLAETISLKTGIPVSALLMKKWTNGEYAPKESFNFGYVNDNDPLLLLPDILTLYYQLYLRGVDGRMGLMAVRREIQNTCSRWGISEANFEEMKSDFECALFGVAGNRQGVDRPKIESVAVAISNTKSHKKVKDHTADYDVRLNKVLRAQHQKKGSRILDHYLIEQMARARQRTPKSKTGAFAAIADDLPSPAKQRQ